VLTSAQLAHRLRDAAAAAREAGQLARSYLADPSRLAVAFKGPQDVLTAADGAVERMIVARLSSAFPGDAFLGEEGTGIAGDRCWVIDPIDGTANFARGLPDWCVSIALVVGGRVDLGVIFDPGHDLLYTARRGEGARCNDRPIGVSATTDIRRARVDAGYSGRVAIDDFTGLLRRLLTAGATVTQCGSAALGLARVADGRLDGYVERHLFAWDVLAGLLLVEEAGGRVNPFLGGDGFTRGNKAIAATTALYPAIAAALDPP